MEIKDKGMTHADSVLTLKRNAIMMNLCEEYRTLWDNADNVDKLMDIAMSANGAEFIAASSNTEWGLTTEYIQNKFPTFINGKYIHRHKKGYTSEMYAGHDGRIYARTTVLVIIGCKAEIYVPKGQYTNIFIDKDSINATSVQCDGYCNINIYNNKNNGTITTSGKGKIEINNMIKENGKMAWTH